MEALRKRVKHYVYMQEDEIFSEEKVNDIIAQGDTEEMKALCESFFQLELIIEDRLENFRDLEYQPLLKNNERLEIIAKESYNHWLCAERIALFPELDLSGIRA
jgi:hypothetical protein